MFVISIMMPLHDQMLIYIFIFIYIINNNPLKMDARFFRYETMYKIVTENNFKF